MTSKVAPKPSISLPSPSGPPLGSTALSPRQSPEAPPAPDRLEPSPHQSSTTRNGIPEGLSGALPCGTIAMVRNNVIQSVHQRDLYGPLLFEGKINPSNLINQSSFEPADFRLPPTPLPIPKAVSEAVKNYSPEEHNQSGFTQELGQTLNEETSIFVEALPADTAGLTQQEKYAALIQGIQARFKGGGYVYGTDSETGDGIEYWSSPTETIADGGQGIDCEDFSFMATHYGNAGAKELGVGGHFGVYAGLIQGDTSRGHAICVYHAEDGSAYVIDGTMYDNGAGNPGSINSVEQYTEMTGFKWYTSDVTPEQQIPMDSEPGFMANTLGFFSSPRPALGDLSIMQLGTLILGPLVILGDLLKLRKEHRGVKRDAGLLSEVKSRNLQGDHINAMYRKIKATLAGVKTILDTTRYVAFCVLAGGAGLAVAPIVLIGATAFRFFISATNSWASGQKKRNLYLQRKSTALACSSALQECPKAARNILEPRIAYKVQNSRVFGFPPLTALKVLVFGGAGISSTLMTALAITTGTLATVTPFVFGPAIAIFLIAGALSMGESMYKGFLLRKQNAAMDPNEQTFIQKRLGVIRGTTTPWYRRVGASINLAGWVVDALEDRLKDAPLWLLGVVRTLFAPIFGISWMLERKAFNEENLFGNLKQCYLDPECTPQQREALLNTLVTYYNLPPEELLLKWMDQSDIDALGSEDPLRSPLARAYAAAESTVKAPNQPFSAEQIEAVKEAKSGLVGLKRLVFGGEFFVVTSKTKAKKKDSNKVAATPSQGENEHPTRADSLQPAGTLAG